jgi:uncharacterized caspase-like protein
VNVRAVVNKLTTSLVLVLSLFAPAVFAQSDGSTGAAGAPVNNRAIRDKWALVIGVSKFANPKVPELRFPAKDARDFAGFLTSKMNFAPDHVLLLTNEMATRKNILDAFGQHWLPQRVLQDDLVLVYISTHGSPADQSEDNYIVAYDTDPEDLYPTGIELQELGPAIRRRTGCDRVVLILDACHSGAAADAAKGIKGLNRTASNFNADTIAGSGMLVITSSRQNEVSWESKRYENSVFTRKLIDSLGNDKTIKQAFGDLQEKVEQEVKFDRPYPAAQDPQMSSRLWKGDDLVLGSVPAAPRHVLPPLPAETYEPRASKQNPQPEVALSASTQHPQAKLAPSASAAPQLKSQPASTAVLTAATAPHLVAPPALQASHSFTDIRGIEAEQDIRSLARLGIFDMSSGEFEPAKPISRSTYARWLVKTNNALCRAEPSKRLRLPEDREATFADVPPSHPDFKYVQALAKAGYAIGIDPEHFDPDSPLTREELIAIKAQVDDEWPIDPKCDKMFVPFKDVDEISTAYLGAIHEDTSVRTTNNISRIWGNVKDLRPQKAVTRAEAATSLVKIGHFSAPKSAAP